MYTNSNMAYAYGVMSSITVKCKIAGSITIEDDAARQILLGFSVYDGELLGATTSNDDYTYTLYFKAVNDNSIFVTRRDQGNVYFAETYDRLSQGLEEFSLTSSVTEDILDNSYFATNYLFFSVDKIREVHTTVNGININFNTVDRSTATSRSPLYSNIFSNIQFESHTESLFHAPMDAMAFFDTDMRLASYVKDGNIQLFPEKASGAIIDSKNIEGIPTVIGMNSIERNKLKLPWEMHPIHDDPFGDNTLKIACAFTRTGEDIVSNSSVFTNRDYPQSLNRITCANNNDPAAITSLALATRGSALVTFDNYNFDRTKNNSIYFSLNSSQTMYASTKVIIIYIPNVVMLTYDGYNIDVYSYVNSVWGNTTYTWPSYNRIPEQYYLVIGKNNGSISLYTGAGALLIKRLTTASVGLVGKVTISGDSTFTYMNTVKATSPNDYVHISMYDFMLFEGKLLGYAEVNSLRLNRKRTQLIKDNVNYVSGIYINKLAHALNSQFGKLTLAGCPLRRMLRTSFVNSNGKFGNELLTDASAYIDHHYVRLHKDRIASISGQTTQICVRDAGSALLFQSGPRTGYTHSRYIPDEAVIVDISNSDIFISFSVSTTSTNGTIWKIGDATNGIAIAVNGTLLGIYLRKSGVLTSFVLTSTIRTNAWYKLLVNGTTAYLYSAAGVLLESSIHGLDISFNIQKITYMSTIPWKCQPWNNDINNISGSGSANAGTTLTVGVYEAECIIANGFVYVISGRTANTSTVLTTIVQFAPIDSNGIIGAWGTTEALPAARGCYHLCAAGNRLYVIGGHSSGGTITSTIYTTTINGDGTLNAWTTYGTALPVTLRDAGFAVIKNSMYLISGTQGSAYKYIYKATIAANGSLGAFTRYDSTGVLDLCDYYEGGRVFTTNSRIYYIGGKHSSVNYGVVMSAPILKDGSIGVWGWEADLPITCYHPALFSTANKLYISILGKLYTMDITYDGVLLVNTFIDTGITFPDAINEDNCLVATSSRLYHIGGRTSANIGTTSTYYIPLTGGANDYIDKLYTTQTQHSPSAYESILGSFNSKVVTGTTASGDYFYGAISDIIFSDRGTSVLQCSYAYKYISVFAGDIQLNYEINTNEVGNDVFSIWVQIPVIASKTDTKIAISNSILNNTYGFPGDFEAKQIWSTDNMGAYVSNDGIDSSDRCNDLELFNVNRISYSNMAAFEFNGTTSYLKALSALSGKHQFSITIALNPSSVSENLTVMDIASDTNALIKQLNVKFTSTGALSMTVYDDAGDSLVSCTSDVLLTGSMYVITYIFDTTNISSTLKCYTNGILSNTNNGDSGFIAYNESKMFIGKSAIGSNFYSGIISGIFISDFLLNIDQIKIKALTLNDALGGYELSNDNRELIFTIPKDTVAESVYNVPVLLCINNSCGTSSTDASLLFDNIKSKYFEYYGSNPIKYNFGSDRSRNGLCLFNPYQSAWVTIPEGVCDYRHLYADDIEADTSLVTPSLWNASTGIGIDPSIFEGSFIIVFDLWINSWPGADRVIIGDYSSSYSPFSIKLNTSGNLYCQYNGATSTETTSIGGILVRNSWNTIIVTKKLNEDCVLQIAQSGSFIMHNSSNVQHSTMWSSWYRINTLTNFNVFGDATSDTFMQSVRNLRMYSGTVDDVVQTNMLMNPHCMDVASKGFYTAAIDFNKDQLIGETIQSLAAKTNVVNRKIKYINTQPWKNQPFNQFGTLPQFSLGTVFPSATLGLSPCIFTTSTRIYLITQSSVYYAVMDSAGVIGSWILQYTSSLSDFANVCCAAGFIIDDKVYINTRNHVYVASISFDGAVSEFEYYNTFTLDTYATNAVDGAIESFVFNGVMYIITPSVYSAYTDTTKRNCSVIYYSYLDDGKPGVWNKGASVLELLYCKASTAVTCSKVYVFGQYSGTGTVLEATFDHNNIINGFKIIKYVGYAGWRMSTYTTESAIFLIGQSRAVSSFPLDKKGCIVGDAITDSVGLYTYSYSPGIAAVGSRLYCIGGTVDSSETSYNNAIQYTVIANSSPLNYDLIHKKYHRKLIYGTNKVYFYTDDHHYNQYTFNTTQIGDITGWSNVDSPNLPTALHGHSITITHNRIYSIGGSVDGVSVNSIYTSIIDANGILQPWTVDDNFPIRIQFAHIFNTSNRIYVLGGYDSVNDVVSDSIYYADVNNDGTIGTWILSEHTLQVPVYDGTLFIYEQYVYIFGGNDGTNLINTCQQLRINDDGYVIQCDTYLIDSPISGSFSAAVKINDYLYLIGGKDATGALDDVYRARLKLSGLIGEWSNVATLPSALRDANVITTAGAMYILGGHTETVTSNIVYRATISGMTQSIGAFNPITQLPALLQNFRVCITNSRIYLIGGYNGINSVNNVYYAAFTGGLNDYAHFCKYAYNGNAVKYKACVPWRFQNTFNNQQYGLLTAWTNVPSAIPTASCESIIFSTDTYVYYIGGSNGSSTIYSTIYRAPINPDGSIGTFINTGASLPAGRSGSVVARTKNRIFLIGGYTPSAVTYTCISTNINSDGTIGTVWSYTTALPTHDATNNNIYSSYAQIEDRIYIVKGTAIYIGIIIGDQITSWYTSKLVLPESLVYTPIVFAIGNRLFIASNSSTNIYQINVNPNSNHYELDSFDSISLSTIQLPKKLNNGALVVQTKNAVYLMGGSTDGVVSNKVYRATVNTELSTLSSAFEECADLTYPIRMTYPIITNSRLYIIGGRNSAVVATAMYTNFTGGTFTQDSVLEFDYGPIPSTESNNSDVKYAYSIDNGITFNVMLDTGIVIPIATSDDSIHMYNGNNSYFYFNYETSRWMLSNTSDIYGAISKAAEYLPENIGRIEDIKINTPLTNKFSVAVSLKSDGTVLPYVTSITVNPNKDIWISDEISLSDYTTQVVSATYTILQYTGNYDAASVLSVYCKLDNSDVWTLCTNGNIPNMPVGLNTTGRIAKFKVVWDLTSIPTLTNEQKQCTLQFSIK